MKVFIYGLRCPETGEIKYVGKSFNPARRLIGHINNSNRLNYKTPLTGWINYLHNKGLLPQIEIFEETNEANDNLRERFYIDKYKETALNIVKGDPNPKQYAVININKILANYNEKLDKSERITRACLAREMYEAGLYKNEKSAYSMLQYIQIGKAKSFDYNLIEFLIDRFDLKIDELLGR